MITLTLRYMVFSSFACPGTYVIPSLPQNTASLPRLPIDTSYLSRLSVNISGPNTMLGFKIVCRVCCKFKIEVVKTMIPLLSTIGSSRVCQFMR